MGLQSVGYDLANKQQQYPQGPSMLLQMSRFPILWLIFKIIYIYVCVYIYISLTSLSTQQTLRLLPCLSFTIELITKSCCSSPNKVCLTFLTNVMNNFSLTSSSKM